MNRRGEVLQENESKRTEQMEEQMNWLLTNACLRSDPGQAEEQDYSPNIKHATNLWPKWK